jgi:hypothetical protein
VTTFADQSPAALLALAQQRRELKFMFRGGEFDRLIDTLLARCQPVRFGVQDESRVSSIYFDDDALSSVQDSLAGASVRSKLRLRWYDADFAADRTHFEVKHRAGLSINKRRSPFDVAESLELVHYAALIDDLQTRLAPGAAAMLAVRSRPTVLVAYRRRHFLEPLSGARLTVDYDIRGFEQSELAAPARRFGVSVPDRFILEVKVSSKSEANVPAWLGTLAGRATRSSKYLMCCARMGWCRFNDPHE